MNEIYYHASNIGNLTEIKPLSKLHGSGEAVAYFTPIRAYALFYLRDMEINHVTCGVNKDGVVVYHEQFPNQLHPRSTPPRHISPGSGMESGFQGTVKNACNYDCFKSETVKSCILAGSGNSHSK